MFCCNKFCNITSVNISYFCFNNFNVQYVQLLLIHETFFFRVVKKHTQLSMLSLSMTPTSFKTWFRSKTVNICRETHICHCLFYCLVTSKYILIKFQFLKQFFQFSMNTSRRLPCRWWNVNKIFSLSRPSWEFFH